MNTPLPAVSPLQGAYWTWVVPPVLFAIAAVATWMLYRHFSRRGPSGG
ncbi:MAG TPA: hypothetical protein PLQ13_08085 [Candidatus Krumholzibacteria bacterium]|nr:hypothetical protein [Candidatus Krumholzibacteria bacterium]